MRTLFKILRLWLDMKSISRGSYPKRVARRYAYRKSGRAIRKIIK